MSLITFWIGMKNYNTAHNVALAGRLAAEEPKVKPLMSKDLAHV